MHPLVSYSLPFFLLYFFNVYLFFDTLCRYKNNIDFKLWNKACYRVPQQNYTFISSNNVPFYRRFFQKGYKYKVPSLEKSEKLP